ncbi:MAG: DNA-nicking Smr family endonuclease [Cellvibrionaceae bacterium]
MLNIKRQRGLDMSDEDFLKEIGGDIEPIRAEQRIYLKKKFTQESVSRARRQAAQQDTSSKQDPLADGEIKQLDPYTMLEFRRPGVQHGAYKQLRLGRYPIDARLDLHRMIIEQARRAVYEFILDCLAHDIRCALIAHGKGERRHPPAVLKSYVAHWLPQIEEVLAFHSAQPQHGGTGACYLMLKKTQKKRRENLERHQRRP